MDAEADAVQNGLCAVAQTDVFKFNHKPTSSPESALRTSLKNLANADWTERPTIGYTYTPSTALSFHT
jgi:hypothetical protein